MVDSVTRRNVLLAASTLLLPVRAHAADLAEVAPGAFVRPGVHEEASAQNQDGIANIGFIIGDRSVAVIDPGGSRRDGEQLRTAIRARTGLPISHMIFTHLHPDHVFGAVAFEDDAPVVVAHARMEGMLVERGEFYRNGLADILGIEAAGDYAKPTLLVQDSAVIELGGRPLRLQAHKTAHTDNDLTILDERTGTLWLGDLLFVDRVPALDGSIVGWLAETKALFGAAPQAVPGHGPPLVAWPGAAAAQTRYLSGIARDIRATLAHGGDIEQAVATAGQDERNHWLLFDDYHGRNVTSAYKELEWE